MEGGGTQIEEHGHALSEEGSEDIRTETEERRKEGKEEEEEAEEEFAGVGQESARACAILGIDASSRECAVRRSRCASNVLQCVAACCGVLQCAIVGIDAIR